MAERAADVFPARQLLVDERVGDVAVECDLRGTARGLTEALPANVVRDRDQPVLGLLGPVPLLDEGAVRVQEGRLRDVLGIGGVAHDRERVAVHVADVPPVQPLEGPIRARPLRQQGRHALVDTCSGRILRCL